MKSRITFALTVILVLAAVSALLYFVGIPLFESSTVSCRYGGGGGKTLGCSTPFGTFVTLIGAAAALAIVLAWNRHKGR